MFIAVDGPDGVGKTTLIQKVIEKLVNQCGQDALYTHEPTRGQAGMKLRELAKKDGSKKKILKLFLEDRKAHVNNFILPKSKEGIIVISDRYKYSTVCYQHLQGFDTDFLIRKNNFLKPDISFIITAEFEILKERIAQRAEEKEVYEHDDYLRKSIELYKTMDNFFPDENLIFLDGAESMARVADEMSQKIIQKKDPEFY